MNIGLLEDNPAICDYITTALEMIGYHISVHTQGSSFLESLFPESGSASSLPYDLVLVDLLLPGCLSGLEVITRIRRVISAERLPIIIITAASEGYLEQVNKSYPGIPILPKPFQLKTLVRLIEEMTVSKDKSL